MIRPTQPIEGSGARELLAERARQLAARRVDEASGTRTPLLTFRQGSERYALDARSVAGVFRLRHLAPLPGAPPQVAGLTSWRGHFLTVLDLERVLGLDRTGLDDRGWILVTETSELRFGLLAGEIGELVEVRADEVRAVDTEASRFAVGTTADATLVLDADRVSTTLMGEQS